MTADTISRTLAPSSNRLVCWLQTIDRRSIIPPRMQRQNDVVTLPSRVTTVAGPVAPMTVMA
jgi:hypothetical protein